MTRRAHRHGTPRTMRTERASSASAFADRTFLRLRGVLAACVGALAFAAGLVHAQTAPTPPGTLVRNTAVVSAQRAPGVAVEVPSNEVTIATVPTRSRATAALLRAAPDQAGPQSTVGPAQCTGAGGQAVDLPPPTLIGGTVLDPTRPVTVLDERAFHGGEPVFLRVTDTDQNLDATRLDYLQVEVVAPSTGDRERIRLVETGPNTGQFTGYVPTRVAAPASGDCTLEVARAGTLEIRYADAGDPTDTAQASAIVDPQGTVLDSRTGAPVSGARIRLVDAATGQPAQVFGDDGRSRFPDEVTSGGTATDAGGTLYQFPPGTYRFPLVRPGTYRLLVEPPAGYDFPSQVAESEVQALPGAPFTLGPGAYGRDYVASSPVAVTLDVPLDPRGGPLVVQISTGAGTVAIGDAVQYTVTIQNTGALTIRDVALAGLLPPGFRYAPGSARDPAGVPRGEPSFDAGASQPLFDVGDLPAGATVTLRFVARVGAGARPGQAVTSAVARSPRVTSNEASVGVRLVDDLFRTRGTIVGRLAVGTCGDAGGEGVANVRVYLEDGRYAVTDEGGRYHFEGVAPGTRVVQIDRPTIPEALVASACEGVASARDPHARLVELRAGGLQRADFRFGPAPPPQGRLRVDGRGREGEASFTVVAEGLAAGNVRALLGGVDGARLAPGGLRVDGRPASVRMQDDVAVVALGEFAPGQSKVLTARAIDGGAVRAALLFDGGARGGLAVPAVTVALADGSSATEQLAFEGVRAPLPPRTGGAVDAAAMPAFEALEPMPRIDSLLPGREWVLPSAGWSPPVPALQVAVKHARGEKVTLTLNGEPVADLHRENGVVDARRTFGVARWRGVPLVDGDNRLVAVIAQADGAEVARLERTIHYGGMPVRAELDAEGSTLVADGRTRPVLALRLYDRAGRPARPGLTGTFRVEPPHRAWAEVQALRDNPLTATGPREPTWTTDATGTVRLELEPASQAGQAVVRLELGRRGRNEEVRAWLAPAARDWVLVGLATGTAAFNRVQQRMESLPDGAPEDGYEGDGRVAFFAKGRIRGDWLLTLAYDSDRDRDVERERTLGAIDPDRYYTLYGDATESRDDAPTSRKLFVRLERREASALFGDFETGYTVTELARYSRTLNGARVEGAYAGVRANAFVARGAETLGRDVFRGDGTSGPYRLSSRDLVVGSDRIRIEVRDRFRSEVVVEERTLQRGLDYDLDYLDGTVFFRRPVPAYGDGFDPVYVVVEYETLGLGAEVTTAGGRASATVFGGRVEAGATYVREGATGGDRQLAGVDVRARLGEATDLRLEAARTRSDDPTRPADGNAYVAELAHVTSGVDARAYVREQETGFGLGQQTATETGTRKFGAEGSMRLTDLWSVRAQAYEQRALDADDRRRLGEGELRFDGVGNTAGVGLRTVRDERAGESQQSDQVYAGVTHDLYDGRVVLKADAEFGLGGRDGSLDFPDRGRVGADWRLDSDYTLFVDHERARSSAVAQDLTRVGVRAQPWTGGQLETALNDAATENGARLYSSVGVTQGWRYDDRWTFDAGLERAATLRGGDVPPIAGLRPSTDGPPLSIGAPADDFTSSFLGAGYRAADWSVTARIEHREGRREDRSLLSLGLYRETRAGEAFSLALRVTDASGEYRDGTSADARLSWAYRPDGSRWVVLDRLDLLFDEADTQRSARVVNNLHANLQFDARTQLGVQFGGRYARQRFDGVEYDGTSVLVGVDARRDLDDRWDVGLQGAWFATPDADTAERSFGVDVGRRFGPRLWVSLGWNFTGFTDRDFSRERYTAQGPYVRFRLHVDQGSLRDFAQAWQPGTRR